MDVYDVLRFEDDARGCWNEELPLKAKSAIVYIERQLFKIERSG